MLSGDVVVHTAYFCSMWTVLLLQRVCRDWRSTLTDHQDLWRHLMFVRFPRMRTLLPRLPFESYQAICCAQRFAELRRVHDVYLPPPLGYPLIGALPPLEAYTFTVEISKDDGRSTVKNVCSDSLIFETAAIDDESPHLATFRCASRLWNVQPQWFSRLDYAKVFRDKGCNITLKTFVTLNNSTGLFYESSIACEVDGSGPDGVLQFERLHLGYCGRQFISIGPQHKTMFRGTSRPPLCWGVDLVVHREEPERCKRSRRVRYGDSETGRVLFRFDNDDDEGMPEYDGEIDPMNTEASAVRVLEGYLASFFFCLNRNSLSNSYNNSYNSYKA